jgi:hypothetical protein
MLMKLSTISRLASAAVVTGISTLAFAAPAQAMVPDPQTFEAPGSSTSGTTAADDGTNWSLIGAEAAGTVAIVGAGAAGFILIKRHNHHTHLPHAA